MRWTPRRPAEHQRVTLQPREPVFPDGPNLVRDYPVRYCPETGLPCARLHSRSAYASCPAVGGVFQPLEFLLGDGIAANGGQATAYKGHLRGPERTLDR